MSVLKEKESICCIICGETTYTILQRFYDEKINDEICYVQCAKCRLVYMNPRPQEIGIENYYLDNYYAHSKLLSYLSKQRTNWGANIKNFLIAFGILINQKKRCHIFYRFLSFIMEAFFNIVGGGLCIPEKDDGKLLDIGCGDGFHLFHFKKTGYEAFGIEQNRKACEVANYYGLNVVYGNITKVRHEEESFDIIRMAGVLEHLHDPIKHLKEVYRILKKDSELIIGIPDFKNPWTQIFGRKSILLTDRTHLFIFSSDNIKTLLRKAGFNRIKIKKLCSRVGIESLSHIWGNSIFSKIIAYNPISIFLFVLLDCFFYLTHLGGGAMVLYIKKD